MRKQSFGTVFSSLLLPNTLEESEMQKVIGRWKVTIEQERYRIFPKNKDGETVPVQRWNRFIILLHEAHDEPIVFKNYLHRGSWLWNDSREPKKPCYEIDVEKELARLLFKGDRAQAKELMVSF